MWARGTVLLVLLVIGQASAQSPPSVPYPPDYRNTLVKYAVVDHVDGLSRSLYVSREAVDAVRRDPRLSEFPVGVVFALDVRSARQLGRDAKTGAARFALTSQGRLHATKDERILHLMRKIEPGFGSRTWAFGGFDPVTAEALKLQLPGDCQLCHQAALGSDMTFSLSLLKRYVAEGSVQYSFCSQPGRQPCPFR